MQTENDQKLDEVRSILQRLQRISTDGEEDFAGLDEPVAAQAGNAAAHPAESRPGQATLSADASAGAVHTPPVPQAEKAAGSKNGKFLVLAGVSILCAGGLAFFWPTELTEQETAQETAPRNAAAAVARTDPEPAEAAPPAPSAIETPKVPQADAPQPLPPLDPDAERISRAEQLMSEGKVSDARQLLQDDLADRVAEAALMLARTYDPNALRLITGANAEPDVAQAEHWYRQWYELAGKDGLAMDPERLNRIIQAMR